MANKKITAEYFEEATGYPPEDDDLERCNCTKKGTLTHSCCGWNEEANLPQFYIGPSYIDNMRKSRL